MSNLFKSGFQGIVNVNQEPYIIDANKRVVEPPRNRILRPVKETDNGGDGFSEGLGSLDEVETPVNQELLDDAMDKAKLVMDDARERADKIVSDAKKEAELIRSKAQEEGYNQGLEEGNMEAMRRADEYLATISKDQEKKIEALRQEMLMDIRDAEGKIVDVACGLVEKLTGILVQEYKPVMLYMINQVLNEEDASRKFVIRVSQEHYAYISDNYDRLAGAANPSITIEVFEDSKLTPGQCLIESETGIVDLSMDVQVRNLITAIKLLSE